MKNRPREAKGMIKRAIVAILQGFYSEPKYKIFVEEDDIETENTMIYVELRHKDGTSTEVLAFELSSF